MELEYKNSFIRDLDSIGSREPSKAIENLIHRIKKADSISEIPRTKLLRSRANRCKIELHVQSKIYWIVCAVVHSKVIFLRIKSEVFFKKNL